MNNIWIEYINGEPYVLTEEELKKVLWAIDLQWEEYLKTLPRKDYYAWSQQDEREWKDAKSVRMECVREEINKRNEFADSLQNPILKRLVRVNEDDVCLELVDVKGSRAYELLKYYNQRGDE